MESSFDDLETVPEEFIDAADHVVVRVRYTGRGRGSGVEFDELSYDVCTVRDGLVVRKREFAERPAPWTPSGSARRSRREQGARVERLAAAVAGGLEPAAHRLGALDPGLDLGQLAPRELPQPLGRSAVVRPLQ